MTETQTRLLALARECLAAAQLLFQHGHRRQAASNSYYAMFHTARAMLGDDALELSSHSAVISEFGRRYARSGTIPPELHRQFIDAADARLGSDYDPEFSITDPFVQQLIDRAQRFLALGERMLQGPGGAGT